MSRTKLSPTISIIIPSYNSRRVIRSCLDSVIGQEYSDPYEIIVVDSSCDGTAEMIASEYPDVSLETRPSKTIPGLARNIGAEKAAGEFLAFTDADCVVDNQWLFQIARHFSEHASVLAGSVAPWTAQNAIGRAEYYIEFREYSPFIPAHTRSAFASCNCAIRREVFQSAGGFPNIRAAEDTLLAHRLCQMGQSILFIPEMTVRHQSREAWGAYLANQRLLGRHSAAARKKVKLPGSAIVRQPLLFPVLPLIRTARTVHFLSRQSGHHALQSMSDLFSVLPAFLVGTVFWSLGFAEGAREKEPDVVEHT